LHINVSDTGYKIAGGSGTVFIHITGCMLSRVREVHLKVHCVQEMSASYPGLIPRGDVIEDIHRHTIPCSGLPFSSTRVAFLLRMLLSLRTICLLGISVLSFVSFWARCYDL